MATTQSLRNKPEFHVLLEALERNRGLKIRLIAELMALWSVRISDLLAIKTNQVDKALKHNVLKIIEGKTKKIKRIVFTKKTLEILNSLRENYPHDKFLCEKRNGGKRKPLCRKRMWEYIKECEVDIIKYRAEHGMVSYVNLGTHSLRKTGARLRVQIGCSLEEIQQLLNHSKPDTTIIYLDNNEEDLSRTYHKGDDALF